MKRTNFFESVTAARKSEKTVPNASVNAACNRSIMRCQPAKERLWMLRTVEDGKLTQRQRKTEEASVYHLSISASLRRKNRPFRRQSVRGSHRLSTNERHIRQTRRKLTTSRADMMLSVN